VDRNDVVPWGRFEQASGARQSRNAIAQAVSGKTLGSTTKNGAGLYGDALARDFADNKFPLGLRERGFLQPEPDRKRSLVSNGKDGQLAFSNLRNALELALSPPR
jgi:hypothetical protein